MDAVDVKHGWCAGLGGGVMDRKGGSWGFEGDIWASRSFMKVEEREGR